MALDIWLFTFLTCNFPTYIFENITWANHSITNSSQKAVLDKGNTIWCFHTTTLAPGPVNEQHCCADLFIISSYGRCCALCGHLSEHPGISPLQAAWASRDVGLGRGREGDEWKGDREVQTDKCSSVCFSLLALHLSGVRLRPCSHRREFCDQMCLWVIVCLYWRIRK